jgi:AraC-like DNA-binding protein/mannose-6-phosphate isomerase-like protein (cupin superfamily)
LIIKEGVLMNVNKYLSAKVSLNKYIDRIVVNGAIFHIHYWGVMPYHYDTLLHKHSFFEICYVVEGKGSYIDDDYTYPLQQNTLFLSKPDVLHQIKSEEGLFLIYVAFELVESESSEEWIQRMEEAKHCSKVISEEKEEKEILLLWDFLLTQATKHEQAFSEEIIKNLSSSLILSLLRAFVSFSMNDKEKVHHEASSTLYHQATLYIKDNLSNSLKLTEVAKYLHISGRHLSRIFVAEAGISYSEFVQNERMQKAATLLKTTDMPIKDIAEETVFTTVNYFTQVFTSKFRSSPGKFRSLYSNVKKNTYNKEFLSST